MVYLIFLIIACIVIIVLLSSLQKAKLLIKKLEETLAEERHKRSMPLLTLEVNTDTDYGIFLINDSYCYAKNITVDDLDVVVDYGLVSCTRQTKRPDARRRSPFPAHLNLRSGNPPTGEYTLSGPSGKRGPQNAISDFSRASVPG